MRKSFLWAGWLAVPAIGTFLACGDSRSTGSASSGVASGGAASGSSAGASSGSGAASGSSTGTGSSGGGTGVSSGSGAASGSGGGTGVSSGSGAASGSGSGSGTGSASSSGFSFNFDAGAFLLDASVTATGTCAALSSCCASLAAGFTKTGCDVAVNFAGNNQTLCAQVLAGFQEGGTCR